MIILFFSKVMVRIYMTKKTNALIFRFGISLFWLNKSFGNNNIKNILQLESLVYKELNKKNLNVLKISYKMHLVNIIVYSDYKIDNKLRNQIIYYYKKNISLYKTIEKFGLNEKSIFFC